MVLSLRVCVCVCGRYENGPYNYHGRTNMAAILVRSIDFEYIEIPAACVLVSPDEEREKNEAESSICIYKPVLLIP